MHTKLLSKGLKKAKYSSVDNIKTGRKERLHKSVDWILLKQETDQQWDPVITVMKLLVP
jgi:hypothetical protein